MKKILMWAGIAFLALWGLRLWENRIYQKARTEERVRLVKELVEKHERDSALLMKEIIAQREQIAAETERIREQLQFDMRAHAAKWASTTNKLESSLKQLNSEIMEAGNAAVTAVPDSGLDAYLRDLSGKLR